MHTLNNIFGYVRTSGRQTGRDLREESPFGKEQQNLFLLHTFFLVCETCWRGPRFYFQTSIRANSLIQFLIPISIFKQSSFSMILSVCLISFPKVVTGKASVPFLNFIIPSHLDGFLAVARICLIHLPQLFSFQMLNCLFFQYDPMH